MSDLPTIHFIDEPIKVFYHKPPVREKTPNCPDGFIWRETTYSVTELLSEWFDFGRSGRSARNMLPTHASTASRRGSWGVGKFFFRVKVENCQVFDLYYDRAPLDASDRKGHWFIFSERAVNPPLNT